MRLRFAASSAIASRFNPRSNFHLALTVQVQSFIYLTPDIVQRGIDYPRDLTNVETFVKNWPIRWRRARDSGKQFPRGNGGKGLRRKESTERQTDDFTGVQNTTIDKDASRYQRDFF